MKILIISHAYVTKVNQRKIEILANYPDLEVALIVPNCWRDPLRVIKLEKTEAPNYKIFPLPIFLNGHPFKYFYSPKIFRIVERINPDIIHIEEEPASFSCFQVVLIKKFLKLNSKIIFFTWENLLRKYKFPHPILEKLFFKNADFAICGNKDAEKIIIKKGFNGKTKIIPQLGIDIELYKHSKNTNGNQFNIGYIGRLVEEKGIFVLLNAIKEIKKDYRLTLVGDGKIKNRVLEFIKRYGLEEKVSFIGSVPHEEVPIYLSKIDVLILPSISTKNWVEQFGHVLIEAMASCVPVIGSDSGAIPEVIGDAGLIFKEGNHQELKEKIELLMADEDLRKKLIEAGKIRVSEKFTNEKIAHQIYEVYKCTYSEKK